jgi:hypothetical protein
MKNMGKKHGLTIGLVGLWFPKIFIGKNHWLRENLQETMVFTNKYGAAVSCKSSRKPIQ